MHDSTTAGGGLLPGQAEALEELQSGGAHIVDRRLMAFDAAALREAFDRVGRGVLTRSPAEVASVSTDPATQTVLFRLGVAGEERSEVVAGGAQLAALLIGFTIRMGVPLPAGARKTISVTPEGVTLWFSTSMEQFLPDRRRGVPTAARAQAWGRGRD